MSKIYLKDGFETVLQNSISIDKKHVYIVLSDTGTLASRVIKGMVDTKYAHSSISMHPRLDNMYSFARKKINNPFKAGMIKEDIRTGLFKKKEDTEIAVFALEVTPEQYSGIEESLQKYWNRRDKLTYNLFALKMMILSGHNLKRFDELINYYMKKNEKFKAKGIEHYFCTQFVTTVLEENGIKLFERPAEVILPNNFYDVLSSMDALVYEGLATDYPTYDNPAGNYMLIEKPYVKKKAI